ncbi:MAG: hypothetical protein LBU39_08855 [Desulfobulbaceae bacterium]|nr:hypothetical protein [Desulfobulbaceae bacterium]
MGSKKADYAGSVAGGGGTGWEPEAGAFSPDVFPNVTDLRLAEFAALLARYLPTKKAGTSDFIQDSGLSDTALN